jgi:hypothetical protein
VFEKNEMEGLIPKDFLQAAGSGKCLDKWAASRLHSWGIQRKYSYADFARRLGPREKAVIEMD